MRRALVVGIDDYPNSPLSGCVNDASRMKEILARNDDGSPNFECRLMVSPNENVTRTLLRQSISELYENEADVALFYFAGHGTVNNLGGYLVTRDAARYEEGVPMRDVITLANRSPVKEVLMIIDCCHSGALGNIPEIDNESALLREGVSILTSSRASQPSMEVDGGGLFTSLVCDALSGGAADICGSVTVASVYAYVDQTLGAWEQRPLFKAHVSRLISLRDCTPEIDPPTIRMLPKYFPDPYDEFPLDPSYEPTEEPRNEEHERIFFHLQQLRGARLVVPIEEEHMYYAALNSKACKLTPLGHFYWNLANTGRI